MGKECGPKISVIVPSYNTPESYLLKLYNSLLNQQYRNFEVIIIDDCSNIDHYSMIKDNRFTIKRIKSNSGPAVCRNIGAKDAAGEFLFFTDSDCELDNKVLYNVVNHLESQHVIVGNTITKTETTFGKAVGCLGFPGGGNIGFDRVWRVDTEGFTNSISSCNLGIKKSLFVEMGMFDTSIPVPGGEDTVFGKMVLKQSYKIKYCPDVIVYHVEKSRLKDFIHWHVTRGRGNYYIKLKLGTVRHLIRLRLWSFKNSIVASGLMAPLVMFLMVLMVLCQQWGYWKEKKRICQ